MTSYANGAVLASPAILCSPRGTLEAAHEALALSEACGLDLLPWQREALSLMCLESSNSNWACGEFGLCVPRQNGKSLLLAARILAGLFLFDEGDIIYTAHHFRNALEVFRIVESTVMNSAELRRRVLDIKYGHGEEQIELSTRARFRILARTRSSGRGLGGDCVILDEALEMRDDSSIAALMPVLSARPNPQLIYSSSAGDAGSLVFASVRDRARANSDSRLGWVEFSAAADDDISDKANWAKANPAIGTLISWEAVEREFEALAPHRFAQERLGIWPLDSSAQIIPTLKWDAARKPSEQLPYGSDFALALDVSPDRNSGAILAAWRVNDGRIFVRVSRYDDGDAWLVPSALELAQAYGVPIAIETSGPARDLADELKRAGAPVQEISRRDFASACARFLSGIVNGNILHNGDACLEAAAANAGSQRVGESWAWRRRNAAVDVSPLTAATLAVWAFEHRDVPVPIEAPAIF